MPDVTINLIDGGGAAVVVPSQTVQLVIGPSTLGVPGQVIPTASPDTIKAAFGYGPLVEYCALAIAVGGTVLAMRAATVTPGYLNGDAVNSHGGTSAGISGATDTVAPIEITTATAHGLSTGQIVTVSGVVGQTLANGTWIITVTAADKFTIPRNGDTSHTYISDTGDYAKTTGVFCNPSATKPRLPGLGGFAQSVVVSNRATMTVLLGTPITSAVDKTVVTRYPHCLQSGDTVTIAGVTTNTTINGAQVATVIDATTFTVPIGSGTGVCTSATACGPHGAFDDYYGVLAIVNDGNSGSGTQVGTSGIQYRLSLDAGRTFGPLTALSTNSSIGVTGTGLALMLTHVGSGDKLYTGDVFIFSTVAMASAASNVAPNHGVSQCLSAVAASAYAVQGWGSTHVLGVASAAFVATIAADTTGVLDTLKALYVFTRGHFSARDASPPVIWGGTGETETVWMTDGSVGIVNTFAATSAKRACVGAGHYNMPSAIALVAGAPRYRRPGIWAQAIRQLLIPPHRHSGRVKDGPLGNIVVDPANDPLDGFVYHDERTNPALTAARFCAFKTRVKKPGVFVDQPALMSPAGSSFTLLPLGNVIDIACAIVFAVGQEEINDDLRLNANGTLNVKDASTLEGYFDTALSDQMLAKAMISSKSVAVDRTENVGTTKNVTVAVGVGSRGYILTEIINIGFQNASA
jgi:hypothetical protein